MASVIIVDDELNALKMLELELNQSFSDLEIIGTFQNPLDALSVIQKEQPDILFVDIEMPNLNGFDLVRELDIKNTQVIFVTAYSQYAIQAIKANALDYLLKPLDSNELILAVNKALVNLQDNVQNKLEDILVKLDTTNKDIIKIPTSNGYAFLEKKSIIYCQSDSNYTHIYTMDKEFLVSKTLKFIQSLLPKEDFLRVHNSYLVNVSHIKEYSRKDGGYVIMSNGKNLRVSNSKKDIFNS